MENLAGGQPPTDAQPSSAPGDLPSALLLYFADILTDLERSRIATTNRLRSLREVKGGGASPGAARLEQLSESIEALEHAAALDLKRAMREHPLGGWVKRTTGVGEKQAARLLATIGDPATRPNVAKLWAYCGMHVVDGKAPKRRRGEKANFNPEARTRVRLIAESCMKNRGSPYRELYDQGRERYDGKVTDGHSHNRALRLVAKAILRDLWVEAKRVAEAS